MMENANNFFKNFEKRISSGVNVAKLGRVVKFKHDTMTVDVLPLPSETSSIILNVPVATVRCSDYVIYYPFKKDDTVVLIFLDNDTDELLFGKDKIASERNHDVSDCVCIGGITLLNESLDIKDKEGLCIQSTKGKASIVIDSGGNVTVNAATITLSSAHNALEGFSTYNGREIARIGDRCSDDSVIIGG